MSKSESLILLRQSSKSRTQPLVLCVPGAGASVTAMIDLVDALPASWDAYGLQPLGLISGETPHTSVEAAAKHHLDALLPLLKRSTESRTIHLIGHSFGGWIAHEIACCLYEQGIAVESLILIDSEPPTGSDTAVTDTALIRKEFVTGMCRSLDINVQVNHAKIESDMCHLFLEDLHSNLVKAQYFSSNFNLNELQKMFETFDKARRTPYRPRIVYPGSVKLVQVSDTELPTEDDLSQRAHYLNKWTQLIPELQSWQGPGDHYSTLQTPLVKQLVEWAFP